MSSKTNVLFRSSDFRGDPAWSTGLMAAVDGFPCKRASPSQPVRHSRESSRDRSVAIILCLIPLRPLRDGGRTTARRPTWNGRNDMPGMSAPSRHRMNQRLCSLKQSSIRLRDVASSYVRKKHHVAQGIRLVNETSLRKCIRRSIRMP